MTLPLVLLNRRRIGGFNPRAILAGSTALVWLDPSDLTTLFQDSAGTTPVTAPGQPVGLALDKSQGLVLGPELWANQTPTISNSGGSVGAYDANTRTMTNPTLGTENGYPRFRFDLGLVSGRRYLISGKISGDLSRLIEIRLNTAGSTSPVPFNSTTGVFNARQAAEASVIEFRFNNSASTSITIDNISVRELPGFHATASGTSRPTYGVVPSRGRVNILNATATLATQTRPVTAAQHTLSFRGTGTVTLTGASTAGPLVGTGANDIVSLTFTPTAGNLTLTVSGTVNDAQLELGAARGTYQLVSDAGGFNITDPAGFPSYPLHYLFFDGVDDFLVTPTITPDADKVQVFAGVRKLSDAARGTVAELSASIDSNNGAFHLTAPNGASATFAFESKGTSLTDAVATPFAAPITRVITGLGDIAGDRSTIRVNGVQSDEDTGDQGTGNYLASAIRIGRRGGTSLPFNGQLYGLIIRFSTANLDASLISQTERWMGQKTGVTIP